MPNLLCTQGAKRSLKDINQCFCLLVFTELWYSMALPTVSFRGETLPNNVCREKWEGEGGNPEKTHGVDKMDTEGNPRKEGLETWTEECLGGSGIHEHRKESWFWIGVDLPWR